MDIERICPVCGKAYTDYPAISRKDNTTEICPDCGMMEALKAAGLISEPCRQFWCVFNGISECPAVNKGKTVVIAEDCVQCANYGKCENCILESASVERRPESCEELEMELTHGYREEE